MVDTQCIMQFLLPTQFETISYIGDIWSQMLRYPFLETFCQWVGKAPHQTNPHSALHANQPTNHVQFYDLALPSKSCRPLQ